MKPRIIVCGLGRTGYKIFNLLRQQGADVIGISDRPLPGERGQDIIIGQANSPTTLRNAGIKEAQTLVLASNDDALNLAILTQARVINPDIRIVNRLFNQTLGERLDRTLPNHVSMSVYGLAAPLFAFAALGSKAIGQLKMFGQTWPIREEVIDAHHPWLGRKLSELWEDKSRMLIYYLPSRGEMDLVSAVVKGECLQLGDHLILGMKPRVRTERSPKIKKLIKTITNIAKFKHHVRPILVVTLALLMTIFLATLTYISVNFETSVVDSLYFSVGMITGAGGQEQVAEQAPDSIKIFTALMMLVGAGVIGICYALINDFILGSRLKQFIDAAKVPSRNHFIICGLGGIGIQVARQLIAQKYEVVVIERNPNSRFIHTARSLGIPVIIEDASLASTLKAANINQAEALIAVTSSDMVNVEIALCAKGIIPKFPVVLRNHDPQFSESVEKVFAFENVLCPTELVTPTFAAAALGGKILGNGMTDDLLWVALATSITPDHPFCGKSVKELGVSADLVPLYLYLESDRQSIHGWELLEIILSPGDVLYLTMPASRLEQLWRSKGSEPELMLN